MRRAYLRVVEGRQDFERELQRVTGGSKFILESNWEAAWWESEITWVQIWIKRKLITIEEKRVAEVENELVWLRIKVAVYQGYSDCRLLTLPTHKLQLGIDLGAGVDTWPTSSWKGGNWRRAASQTLVILRSRTTLASIMALRLCRRANPRNTDNCKLKARGAHSTEGVWRVSTTETRRVAAWVERGLLSQT